MVLDLRGVLAGGGPSEEPAMGLGGSDLAAVDPAEQVARVALDRRARLLRFYRRRLRFEDLEDCYSQATLELVARARRSPFVSEEHAANALELRFKSRIEDRRRAVEGRSAIESAIARAVPVDAPGDGGADLEDRAAAVERQVFARADVRVVRELAADLTRDQQLVLASQALVDMEPAEFCGRYGWSVEKYRKVAQRARGKLRALLDEYERGDRCRRLEPDLLALSAGVADGAELARARAHVANCPGCARMLADLERGARSVAALLPPPAAAAGGGLLAGAWAAMRRLVGFARHPLAEAGTPAAGAGAGVAGGSLVSAGALKVGIAAVCVVGAAGTYAACSHLGVLPVLGLAQAPHVVASPSHAAPGGRDRADARKRARAGIRRREHPARARRRRADRRAHRATGVTRTVESTTATTAPPVVAPPPSTVRAVRRVRRRRLSAIAQIRLEFGRPRSHATAAGSAAAPAAQAGGASGVPSSATNGSATAAPPASSSPPAQTPTQASQTQSEFGFEK
jgi:DNA-directed RNA polymerase specialized sigma24 family protein